MNHLFQIWQWWRIISNQDMRQEMHELKRRVRHLECHVHDTQGRAGYRTSAPVDIDAPL